MNEVKWKRLICMTLAVILTLATPVLAVTQAQIDALKRDASALSQEKKELRSKLAALADDKSQAIEKKELLDQQIATTAQEIKNTEAQIALYAELIAQKEAELADAQAQEEAQYDLFCRRVRKMEERGEISYWAVLFRANSFTDLLSRLDAINEIMDADQKVIDTLKKLQLDIENKKADLETSKAESEEAKATLETRKKELNTQRTEANRVIQELAENEEATEAAIAGLDEEQEAIQQEIKRLNRELEEQRAREEAERRAREEAARQEAARRAAEAAQNNNSGSSGSSSSSNDQSSSSSTFTPSTQTATSGGYIWPVDSRYITSTMGGRSSPGGIGSTNHQGTDIGRVGYTSSVYAAKAGTVIVSKRSSSYGEYVVISHGSGNTTLYAHLSSRKVSVGQYVNQGAVIGITGSTGNSTGPHLHFEVMENGSRVDPLKNGYLTGATYSKSA